MSLVCVVTSATRVRRLPREREDADELRNDGRLGDVEVHASVDAEGLYPFPLAAEGRTLAKVTHLITIWEDDDDDEVDVEVPKRDPPD